MKKVSKKICSIVLALALCMSLCCTAFAASSPETTGSITINGAIANETYTIYQIFDLTYTDYEEGETPESYSYKVCAGWESFLETGTITVDGTEIALNTLFILTDNGYLDPDSPIFDYADDSDVVAAVARAALAYATEVVTDEDTGETGPRIVGTSVSYTATYDQETGTWDYVITPNYDNVTVSNISSDENGYVTGDLAFNGLSLGYYLVGTSLGSLCMLDSTDPNAVVNEKNGTPTLEKWVHENTADDDTWQHEDDASNQDDILFEINISNINGAYNLVLHDTMDDELVIEDTENFHMNGVTLYTANYDESGEIVSYTSTPLIENTDYTITVGECTVEGCTLDNCAFEVHFLREFNDVDENAYITLTYYLKLETEGDSYDFDYDEIDNFATLTFATSSQSPIVEAETYSFGFEIFKYTGDLDGEETEYGTYYMFQDTITHDGPTDVDNEFYFVATDGNYEYYAIMQALDEDETTYLVTGWVDNEDDASSITEPQDETTFTIYVTEASMQELVLLEAESSVESLLADARFHLLEEGGNADEQQDEDALEYTVEYGTVPGTASPLANATFEVKNEDGSKTAYFLYEEEQNIYLFEGWVEDLEEDQDIPANCTTSLTSDSDGMIYVEGLDRGTYTVTEIAAPDGFNKLDDSITVEIWATYDENTGEILDHGVNWIIGSDTGSGTVNVLNNTGSKLPSTGGIGTTIFYIIGGILVVGAVVVLVTRRRMTSES